MTLSFYPSKFYKTQLEPSKIKLSVSHQQCAALMIKMSMTYGK